MNQTESPRSRWKNPLITCGIGCGALVIVVIVAMTGFYFWVVSPGTQIPTQRVLGPESLAFLRIEKISEDEGFQSMAADLLLGAQELELERSARKAPIGLGWLNQLQRSSPQEVVANLKRDLPTDITVTIEAAPGSGTLAFAIAVNLSRYPRLLRLFFTWFAEDFAKEVQEEFPGAGLEFVENTAVWAQTPEIMAVVMDRARRPELPRGASTEILRLLESGSERWDIYAAAENREKLMGETARLLADIPSDFPLKFPDNTGQLLQRVRTMWLGLDIVSRDLLEIELETELQNAADADRWEQSLNDFVSLNQPAEGSPLRLAHEIVRRDGLVSLRLSMEAVKAAIRQAIQEAGNQRQD